MDRLAYQCLRFEIQTVISDAMKDSMSDPDALTNNVMRLLLKSLADADVKRQRMNHEFKNFRRNPEATAPSWAYRKPGISSRLPTL